MARPTVTVIGYLSLDRIEGPAGRFDRMPGGSALYAALAAARAGAEVRLLACAGRDFPKATLDALRGLGISTDGVAILDEPSRRALLIDVAARERCSPHHDEPGWWAATLLFRPPRPATGADAYVLGPMPGIYLHEQIAACRALGGLVLADTSEAFAARSADLILELLPDLDLFAPSVAESRLLCSGRDDDGALRALGRRCPRVVQKRGAAGLAMAQADGAPLLRRPAVMASRVEPTGAGDAVLGALAVGLATGLEGGALLDRASAMAAIAVAAPGPLGLLFDDHGSATARHAH